jgi:opacity protein-like surface antigen
MVRSARTKLLLMSILAARAVLGQHPPAGPQNSDISILAGPVFGSSQVTDSTGATVKASGTWSFQSSFAHTIHSYSFADLWFEFASTAENRESRSPGGGLMSISYSAFYETPGLRLSVPVGSRVSFYAAAGGGYVRFDADQEDVNSGSNTQHLTNYHGAFDYGGGMDFRLTRLLSLRGEIRDFVTGSGLGGVSGRHHPIIGFGMAAHF